MQCEAPQLGHEMSLWPKLAAAVAVESLFVFGRLMAGTKPHFPSIIYIFATLLFLVPGLSSSATAASSVGMVTKVTNQARVGGETAVVGTLVHMNDTLTTGPEARLLVTFRDKTELTLGENASVLVDRYVFDPDAGIGEATLNVTRGAFRFTTGALKEMRDKNIKVTTHVAALAVRGTDFWAGPIDGQYGVLLLDKSRLSVANEEGAVMLADAGMGTDIPAPIKQTGAPSRPYKWPPDKVARALAQTNIGPTLNPGVISPFVPIIPFIPGVRPEPPPRSP
jgi:hypothetical protein